MPNTNEWIKCTDRLPEKSGLYHVKKLVIDCDFDVHPGIALARYEKGNGWRSLFEVIEWQPLPTDRGEKDG